MAARARMSGFIKPQCRKLHFPQFIFGLAIATCL
jgi:hypothetical protein